MALFENPKTDTIDNLASNISKISNKAQISKQREPIVWDECTIT